MPSSYSVTDAVLAISTGFRRETTWTIEQIDKQWGDQIRAARAASMAVVAETPADA